VVVARTHASGLLSAQRLAQEAESPRRSKQILGLVLVADAPGRLPPACQDLAHLVSGAYKRSWLIPWDERLRVGPYDATHLPRVLARLGKDLIELTRTPEHRSPPCSA